MASKLNDMPLSAFNAYVSHNASIDIRLPVIDNPLWWQTAGLSYTASGYGAKIPTSYMVRFKHKWRRVYCRIYSNIGTCYIVVNKQNVTVDFN